MAERVCDGKEGSEWEENANLTPSLSLSKNTPPGVKPWDAVCVEKSSCTNRPISRPADVRRALWRGAT